MNLGQVYTKRIVADFMVGLFTLGEKSKVLDPCFGRGVFVESLVDNTEYIVDGVEIDATSFPQFANPDCDRCTLWNGNFFDVDGEYDGIVMNPPYVRHEDIDKMSPIGVTKKKLQSKCGVVAIPGRANLYMYFIFYAIQMLRDGGELVVIFPNSWTNTPAGRHFYWQMAMRGYVADFIDVEGEAFEGSPMVDVCILRFVKGKFGHTEYRLLKISTDGRLTVEDSWRHQGEITGDTVPLSSVAMVRRGITTGANKLFINPPLFSDTHLVDILSSPKNIKGYSTEKCMKDRLLALKDGDVLNDEETVYIDNCAKSILKEKSPKTLKTMIDNGQAWYHISVPAPAQIIFSYIVRNQMRFVLNTEWCNVRDNFYMLNTDYDSMLMMALLNNYHVYMQLEQMGKSYGKGVLKLQKYDIDEIKVPHPDTLSDADRNKISELASELVDTGDDRFVNLITEVLGRYYGDETAMERYRNMKTKRLAGNE